MSEQYHKFQPKLKTIDKVKDVLPSFNDELPQASLNKAVLSFTKRLTDTPKLNRCLISCCLDLVDCYLYFRFVDV